MPRAALSSATPAQPGRGFPRVCEKPLGRRGTEVPGTLGCPPLQSLRQGPGRGHRAAGLDDWARGAMFPPLVARAQPIRVQAGLGRQVVGVGAGAGVCVRVDGEVGLGWVRDPKEFPHTKPIGLGVWGPQAQPRGSCPSFLRPLPTPPPRPATTQRAAASASRVCILRARPLLPRPRPRGWPASPRRRPPPPPLVCPPFRAAAALLPGPTPGDRAWSGWRPEPEVSSAPAGGRRRRPGPSLGEGTGSGRGSLSPGARSRAAGAAPPPGRCLHPSRKPRTALGVGEGTRDSFPSSSSRTYGSHLSRPWWSGSLRGRVVVVG